MNDYTNGISMLASLTFPSACPFLPPISYTFTFSHCKVINVYILSWKHSIAFYILSIGDLMLNLFAFPKHCYFKRGAPWCFAWVLMPSAYRLDWGRGTEVPTDGSNFVRPQANLLSSTPVLTCLLLTLRPETFWNSAEQIGSCLL